MEPKLLVAQYQQRVEIALIRHLGAQRGSLRAKIDEVAVELPEDLGGSLRDLAGNPSEGYPETSSAVAEYAFRCGQVIERIESFARNRAAEDLIYTDAAGNPLTDPARTDLDKLSRFRVARDRLLRKAADFSLKVLAIAVVVLVLGVLLGVI